jgi:hypothetical protein
MPREPESSLVIPGAISPLPWTLHPQSGAVGKSANGLREDPQLVSQLGASTHCENDEQGAPLMSLPSLESRAHARIDTWVRVRGNFPGERGEPLKLCGRQDGW